MNNSKYTKEYVTTHNVVIKVSSKEEWNVLGDLFKDFGIDPYVKNLYYRFGGTYFIYKNGSGEKAVYADIPGFELIDFSQLNINNMKTKQIIGYALKQEKDRKWVALALGTYETDILGTKYFMPATSEYVDTAKNIGFFDAVFDPVYGDTEIKFGQWKAEATSINTLKVGCMTFSKNTLLELKQLVKSGEQQVTFEIEGMKITEELLEDLISLL